MTSRHRFVAAIACMLALGMLGACEGSSREVLVIVRSSYPREGYAGVDRYRLTIYRRNHTTARWEDTHANGSGVYLFSSSVAVPGGGSMDAGSVMRLSGEVGRHLLRATDPTDTDDVLVEAVPGRAIESVTFEPAGPPSVAQFRFPPGRGQIVLDMDEACRGVDLVGWLGPHAPYYRCVAPGGCPMYEPICIEFRDGGGVSVPCAEDLGRDAGTGGTGCPSPEPVTGDASTDAQSRPGSMATTHDCAPGTITCGSNGMWSRCLPPSLCEPGGDEDQECCPLPTFPPGCSIPDGARVRNCHADLACDALGRCRACGRAQEPCCPGALCIDGTCDANNLCACGLEGQLCCGPDSGVPECSAGLSCVAGHCTICGVVAGQPCCDTGPGCVAGMTCDPSTMQCQPCGSGGQLCCRNGSSAGICIPGFACDGTNHCAHCGNDGELCCNGMCNMSTCDGTNHCHPCGTVGTPCCGGGCSDGSVCSGGNCVGCGGQGQLCCNGICGSRLRCLSGSCVPCGDVSQPCCPDGSCAAGRVCITHDGSCNPYPVNHCDPCGAYTQHCCPVGDPSRCNSPYSCRQQPSACDPHCLP